ncbi:hypothetical protein KIL84_021879 [Mauremys mutica]|uniref:Uncharacterized protein n=1 Tax=Mauremys mutica TaxID=74926 RepID=A0A9D4B3Q2_9SAUR|nr:hypothetical protein KIL84_021879 [Mauremys mutica]
MGLVAYLSFGIFGRRFPTDFKITAHFLFLTPSKTFTKAYAVAACSCFILTLFFTYQCEASSHLFVPKKNLQLAVYSVFQNISQKRVPYVERPGTLICNC